MRGAVKRGAVMRVAVMSGGEWSMRSPANVNQRTVLSKDSKHASEKSGEAIKMRC
jgi:hypothetical protein